MYIPATCLFLDLSREVLTSLAYCCSPACWQDPSVALLWRGSCRHLRSPQELTLHFGQVLVPSKDGENWRAGSWWRDHTPAT